MLNFQGFFQYIWDWSRMFFGTVFVACVIISFILFLIELIIYRRKRNGEKKV